MKIIQINAWCGRLNGPLARFIHEEQADIVCMQEALKPHTTKAPFMDDQFGFLAEVKAAGSFEYELFAPNWGFKLGGDTINEGLAILSRFPLLDSHEFHTNNEYHIRGETNTSHSNTRNCQTCTVLLPNGTKLSLLNYQGYLDGPKETGTDVTIATMRKVRDAAIKLPQPLIICGDFNIWPSSPALRELDDLHLINLTLQHKVTGSLSEMHRAPAEDRAIATCDYILISPDIRQKKFQMSEKLISDHKALILEFDL